MTTKRKILVFIDYKNAFDILKELLIKKVGRHVRRK